MLSGNIPRPPATSLCNRLLNKLDGLGNIKKQLCVSPTTATLTSIPSALPSPRLGGILGRSSSLFTFRYWTVRHDLNQNFTPSNRSRSFPSPPRPQLRSDLLLLLRLPHPLCYFWFSSARERGQGEGPGSALFSELCNAPSHC